MTGSPDQPEPDSADEATPDPSADAPADGPTGGDAAATDGSGAESDLTRLEIGPSPGPILATDSLAQAGRKAMWLHVQRLLQYEALVRDREQPYSLRKHRVATRRLRAALRLFGPAFRPHVVDSLSKGLRELTGAVGRARDLDVRGAGLAEWAQGRGPESVEAVIPLVAAWREERRTAADDLERHLASRRHERLIARLADFVRSDVPARPEDRGAPPVRDREIGRAHV